MPRTKTAQNFTTKSNKKSRTASEIKTLYVQMTGKKPINQKTKKLTAFFRDWKKTYQEWETKKLAQATVPRSRSTTPQSKTPVKKTSVKKTPVKKTSVKKTPVKKTSVKKTPVKKTSATKTPAKKTPPSYVTSGLPFPKFHMKRIMKQAQWSSKVSNKLKKHDLSKDAVAVMNTIVKTYLKTLKDRIAKFLNMPSGDKKGGRKTLTNIDLEQILPTMPFSKLGDCSAKAKKVSEPDGIVNISPEGISKTSSKYKCYGINVTAVKNAIISKGGVPSKWKKDTIPVLCRAIIGYVQGIVISVEKLNKINNKRTVDAESIKAMSEIINSCSCF